MPAQLRLTLSDEEAAALDAARGAATRTAYAGHLLRGVLLGDEDSLEALLRRVVGEEVTHALLTYRAATKGTDHAEPDATHSAIRKLPPMR